MIHLVLGGARSGKSAFAETLVAPAPTARPSGGSEPVAYLATGWADPGDHDMAARIERHRRRRGDGWETIEVGAALAAALVALPAGQPALVDALGTWVAAHADLDPDVGPVLAALAARAGLTVVVSDEVGLGVHPETVVGRRFRDVLGEVNQAVAAAADAVTLVVAGLPVVVKPAPPGAP